MDMTVEPEEYSTIVLVLGPMTPGAESIDSAGNSLTLWAGNMVIIFA